MVRGCARRAVLALVLAPLLAACSRGVAVPPSTTTPTPTESTSTAAPTTSPTSESPDLLRVAVPFDQPGLGRHDTLDFARAGQQQQRRQREPLHRSAPATSLCSRECSPSLAARHCARSITRSPPR